MARRKPRKSVYIPPRHEVENRRAQRRGSAARRRTSTSQHRRPDPKPPSLRRTLRLAPVYFLVVFALQYMLAPHKLAQSQRVAMSAELSAVFVLAFVPFGYFMDRARYNGFLRKQQREADERRRATVEE